MYVAVPGDLLIFGGLRVQRHVAVIGLLELLRLFAVGRQ